MSFFFKHHRGYTFVSLWHFFACVSGPLPGFSSRGEKTPEKGNKKQKGGHIFKILYWMYAVTREPNVKWHRFQVRDRAPLALRWRRPWCVYRLPKWRFAAYHLWNMGIVGNPSSWAETAVFSVYSWFVL